MEAYGVYAIWIKRKKKKGNKKDGTWHYYVGRATRIHSMHQRLIANYNYGLRHARDHILLTRFLDTYLGDVMLTPDTEEIHIRGLVEQAILYDISATERARTFISLYKAPFMDCLYTIYPCSGMVIISDCLVDV